MEPDRFEKLTILGNSAAFDLEAGGSCAFDATPRLAVLQDRVSRAITRVSGVRGRSCRLLKILQSNACSLNCNYCPNRAAAGRRSVSYSSEELAAVFMLLYEQGEVDGLFLSSAVRGSPAGSMDSIVTTAEILRTRHRYRGYLHLKIMPGSPTDRIRRAVELADRVSVNMEAPNQRALDQLAPMKRLQDQILPAMRFVRALSALSDLVPSGQTTQIIVGAGTETDREILQSAQQAYGEGSLARVYFSAFEPVPGTPMEDAPPAPPLREHRLYQADFLLRRYSGAFHLGELVFEGNGGLSLDIDPKLAIALANASEPVEVNTAAYAELLRVPGIGPKSARKIVQQRAENRFSSLAELRRSGVAVKRAAPFVLINGRRPSQAFSVPTRQLAIPGLTA
jgi:predicted DNA-binding helix-hairpin-helix protein